MDTKYDKVKVLKMAADLLSEEGENSEYDRAIVEMTSNLLGFESENRETLHLILQLVRVTK